MYTSTVDDKGARPSEPMILTYFPMNDLTSVAEGLQIVEEARCKW